MHEKKLDKIDFIAALIYVLIGAIIWFSYNFSLFSQKNINNILSGLTFTGPLGLFLVYYKRFRIPAVTFLWLGIGIIQWVFVGRLKENPDFNSVAGSYADHDVNLLVMIILATVFRLLSLTIMRQEFMVAAWFSPRDKRKLNALDYILSITGFLILTIGLTVI